MKILVFGNALLKEDNLALKLMPKLKKKFRSIEFKEFDPIDELDKEGKFLNILDIAKGINDVLIIDDVNKLKTGKIYSMHDFDLAMTLKLMIKARMIDGFRIICIPYKMKQSNALKKVERVISTLLSENDLHSSYKDHKHV